MARLEDFDPTSRKHLTEMSMPVFAATPWTSAKPAPQARVAIVSTAGLQLRGDRPFAAGAGDFRPIPGDATAGDLVMSHVSTNFDRSGFQADINVVFPIDRLNELRRDGVIGSVASIHYSFMGATPPERIEQPARQLAGLLKQDRVDCVLLVPV
ncbi:MAG: glycine/sarcosine/betaine reductase selenoprotein B family protein [Hyphomicrobiaceae bacterium]|nr:glycine/sarcosine/betaine reductase selenoprotein B family protein [Hyphomicrobiaceae bacterium]